MLFNWGENECLRAWTISPNGTTQFVAKSHEVASEKAGGKGGMPGGLLAVSSNGSTPGTGIVWSLAPMFGDANRHVVQGILRAYDAEALDPMPNTDGTPRLKLLWDSRHIPGNKFNHSKFCPPVIADGRILVPTYDGRVDVYGLRQTRNRTAARPTNFTRNSPGLVARRGAGSCRRSELVTRDRDPVPSKAGSWDAAASPCSARRAWRGRHRRPAGSC